MDEVMIVDYDDKRHHEAFRALNEEWISRLFEIEELDRYELSHPVENIIDRGGYIFVAELNGVPVGTFAMMKSPAEGYDFEMVKFAVSPKAQGHGIGGRLVERCLAKAREVGARRLYLEGNRRCGPANHLYAKYGFREIPITTTEYARCDIKMALEL